MADLDTMIAGLGTAPDAGSSDAGAQQAQKQDKNKPVKWVPKAKGQNTLKDAKLAVENEKWDQAFLIMMELNKDPKMKDDPNAKAINQMLMNKMGMAAQGGQ